MFKTKIKKIICIDNDESNFDKIYDWIDNHNPYDKAGGYAIQEEFRQGIWLYTQPIAQL